MIISKITFSNFRNFGDENVLEFSTQPGKINIVYGLNGEGKTTLHQLFRWLFYGSVNFNNSAILYNLPNSAKLNEGKTMDVKAQVDFEHEGKQYSLTRIKTFIKKHGSIDAKNEQLHLLEKTKDKRWLPVDNPDEKINEMLPVVFSKYFFFDGERMVDELKVRRREISNDLKDAVYYLFNLQEYSNAIQHIGNVNSTTTALGKLKNDPQYNETESPDLLNFQIKRKKACEAQEQKKKKIDDLKKARQAQIKTITELSESIGNSKGSEELEATRKQTINDIADLQSDLKSLRKVFGQKIYEVYPLAIVSSKALTVKDEILKKIKNNKEYIPGLNVNLIDYLLEKGTCLCDRKLTKKEITILNDYKNVLPPKSYQSLYHEFANKCRAIAESQLNLEKQEQSPQEIIEKYLGKFNQIDEKTKKIGKIDEKLKTFGDIDSLIIKRKEAESERDRLTGSIDEATATVSRFEVYIKDFDRKIDRLTSADKASKLLNDKIKLLTDVRDYLYVALEDKVKECRADLQKNVVSLIDKILSSKKNVELMDDFNLKVTNSYGDEYKNEGTFAVVSFSFILGLLETLRKYSKDSNKKSYALVLDAPYSKLDGIHKDRVTRQLFAFGDQIILFSKDNLSEYMDKNHSGNCYLLNSENGEMTLTTATPAKKQSDIDYYFSPKHIKEVDALKSKAK